MKIWERTDVKLEKILERIEQYENMFNEYQFDGFKIYPGVGIALCFYRRENNEF